MRLHVLRGDAGRFPELAGLVRIDFADHQPVGLLQGVDILLRVRTDGDSVHAEREHALDGAAVHVVPDFGPGVLAFELRQIVERPVVLLPRGVAVERLEQRDGELRRVRPVVHGLPRARLGSFGSDARGVRLEIGVGGRGHFEIAGEQVEDARHVGGALYVGVAAQRVDAAAGASHVAHQELQDGRGADDLRAEAVMRPADGVDDGAGLLHVAILADGGEEFGGLEELILRNAGDALHHFRRIARVLLLEQLEDRARMLQRKIVGRFAGLGFLVIPGGAVVDGGGGVEPGKQAVLRQLESVLNEEGGVGVVQQVIARDPPVLDGVADQAA